MVTGVPMLKPLPLTWYGRRSPDSAVSLENATVLRSSLQLTVDVTVPLVPRLLLSSVVQETPVLYGWLAPAARATGANGAPMIDHGGVVTGLVVTLSTDRKRS